jgi:predicted nucleic acid-binding protein
VNFWDASAVVPLLTDEAASAQRQRQAELGGEMIVWWGTSVECISAVQRAVREQKISQADAVVAVRHLRELEQHWMEIEPADQVRQQAARLLRTHPLRAADALQLAAAIIGSGYDPAGLTFLTADTRLAEAAAKEGFKVA